MTDLERKRLYQRAWKKRQGLAFRLKRAACSKQWREKNKEHVANYSKAYKQKHREELRAAAKKYYWETK